MQIAEPWGFVLCVALVLLVLGTTAGYIDTRLWVSEPLVCTAVGIAIGPLGLGLLSLPADRDPHAAAFMREGRARHPGDRCDECRHAAAEQVG